MEAFTPAGLRGRPVGPSREIGSEKQQCKNPVSGANREHGHGQPVLVEQDIQSDSVRNLLENRRQDERAILRGICGYHQEYKLPGQTSCEKSIEVLRVSDPRRRPPPDGFLHETNRREDHQAVNSGNEKDDLCEAHGREARVRAGRRFYVAARNRISMKRTSLSP